MPFPGTIRPNSIHPHYAPDKTLTTTLTLGKWVKVKGDVKKGYDLVPLDLVGKRSKMSLTLQDFLIYCPAVHERVRDSWVKGL